MSLVDSTYFTGNLLIAGMEKTVTSTAVCNAINTYEEEYAIGVLGFDFYYMFSTGLTSLPVAQRWVDLRDGAIWTYLGKKQQWTNLRLPIARYVYFHYQRNNTTQTNVVGNSVNNTENATRVSYADKTMIAWNEMCTYTQALWKFLLNARDGDGNLVYPEFSMTEVCCRHYLPVNSMNI